MGDSALGRIHDPQTGWSFTGVKDPSVGFYLEGLSHEGHHFADSIRVERIAVAGFSDRDPRRSRDDIANHHVFSLATCTEVQPPTLIRLPRGSTDPLGYYAPRFKVAARYEMSRLLNEPDQVIQLELAVLFTAYNKDASHEPAGLVRAARVYPTLTFTIPAVSHEKPRRSYRHATAVQALFRINLRFENEGVGNQVGVFTDLENMSLTGAPLGLFGSRRPGAFPFLAAEKPVVFEVVGRGLDHGSIGGWDGARQGWDNIHQWSHPAIPGGSNPNDGLKNQPNTPGLPYGGHQHWRWGETAVTGGVGLEGAGKHFGGARGPGSPLVDPNVGDQTLDFALVDLSAWSREEAGLLHKLDTNPVTYLFRDFSEVWSAMQGVPGMLMPSANILTYLSIIAWGPGWNLTSPGYREFFPGSGVGPDDFPDVEHGTVHVLPSWGGTLNAHGTFFAHEDLSGLTFIEKSKLGLVPGSRRPQHIPFFPKQTWRR